MSGKLQRTEMQEFWQGTNESKTLYSRLKSENLLQMDAQRARTSHSAL